MSHSRIRFISLLRRPALAVTSRRVCCGCVLVPFLGTWLLLFSSAAQTQAQVILDEEEASQAGPLTPVPTGRIQLQQESGEPIELPRGRPAVPGDVLERSSLPAGAAPWSLNSGKGMTYGAGYPDAGPTPWDTLTPWDTPILNLTPPRWSQPLSGTSWLNRPGSLGWMLGSVRGDELINGRVQQRNSLLGGYRLGWDFDHHWGSEFRLALADLRLDYNQLPGSVADHLYFDANLLYYPWGDTAWRPYLFAGLGWANFAFRDDNGQLIDETTLGIPFGVGLKYYLRNWLALRLSMTDNFSVGTRRIAPQHNLSWTVGAEVRFGSVRTSYFPFHPGGSRW